MCEECKRGFKMLSMYGVPEQRAKNVANGIIVLMDRMGKEEAFLKEQINRQTETFINIIHRCRGGYSRKDICDFASNALAEVNLDSLKKINECFEKHGKPENWYYKAEEQS